MSLFIRAVFALLLCAAPAMAQDQAAGSPRDDLIGLMETDPAEARRQAEQRVAQGDAEAANMLSILLQADVGGPANPERSRALLERAVAGGSNSARVNLATRLLQDPDPVGNSRAVGLLTQAVEADPEYQRAAAYPFARAYLFGWGVERDMTRAVGLLKIAVEHAPSNADARFLLGRAYQNGWGVERDDARAYGDMRLAAALGDPRASWQAGMMLLNGDGVAADPQAAYGLVRSAAEAGHGPAMISNAVMLALGQGVEPDPAEARTWYLKAAQVGSAHALRGLGAMLVTGEGGEPDVARGLAYLELAHEGGDDLAATLLAEAFAVQTGRTPRAEIDRIKAEWASTRGKPGPTV